MVEMRINLQVDLAWSWWSEDGTGWMYVDGLNNEINNGMNEMNE